MKNILLITSVCTFLLACASCGQDDPLPKPPVDNAPAATQPAETAAESTEEVTAEQQSADAETSAPTEAEQSEISDDTAEEVPVPTRAAAASGDNASRTDNAVPAATQAPAAQEAATRAPAAQEPATKAPATQAPAETESDFYAPPPPVYDIPGLTYITDPKTGVKILLASKSYSMPADFDPGLEDVTYEYFCKMQSDAAAEGLYLQLSSGYRSYYDQQIVYNGYVYDVGSDVADTFSARPGYSEHQTGLVIDLNSIDDSFGYTPEAAWVAEHAHEYGFIIRYPDGMDDITGYKYEPWHIRYVGSAVATEIYKQNTCLETYLGLPNSEYSGSYEG